MKFGYIVNSFDKYSNFPIEMLKNKKKILKVKIYIDLME